MRCVVLLGAPGAGKGTQASGLAERTGTEHLSTGELFRSHVGDGTDLGRAAQRFLDAGEYVPDELTNAMVRDRIVEVAGDGGFVLDGYPRTLAQVGYLDDVLAGLDLDGPAVIALDVEQEELIRRLVQRAASSGRSDDDEETIRRRQEVYLSETAPLLDLYRRRGQLREIDGSGDPADIARRIDAALASLTASDLSRGA
jgi:adenylate kinase